MPNVSVNHRRDERRKLIIYLEVLDRDAETVIGRLVDIHANGMLLVSADSFAVNQTLNLRILVGDELLESMFGNLDVKAQVRWSQQDVNPDYYVTGLQFMDVTPEQERLVWELIRSISFEG